MSKNLTITVNSQIDINSLNDSRLSLKKGKLNSYELVVLKKDEWTKQHHSSQGSGYIDNLGKIIKLVNEAKLENLSNDEKTALLNRLDGASKKHHSRFKNVQWLKFLVLPLIFAKIFHWTVFDNYGLTKKIKDVPLSKENKTEKNTNEVKDIAPQQEVHKSKSDFKVFLGQCKNGVISNSENLNETLEGFRVYIEQLFLQNYDGYHDGIPGPTFSGLKFFHIFEFSATDTKNWQIKLHLDSHGNNCFNVTEEEEALNIVKTYVSMLFQDKLDAIQIEDKQIQIKWKS